MLSAGPHNTTVLSLVAAGGGTEFRTRYLSFGIRIHTIFKARCADISMIRDQKGNAHTRFRIQISFLIYHTKIAKVITSTLEISVVENKI